MLRLLIFSALVGAALSQGQTSNAMQTAAPEDLPGFVPITFPFDFDEFASKAHSVESVQKQQQQTSTTTTSETSTTTATSETSTTRTHHHTHSTNPSSSAGHTSSTAYVGSGSSKLELPPLRLGALGVFCTFLDYIL